MSPADVFWILVYAILAYIVLVKFVWDVFLFQFVDPVARFPGPKATSWINGNMWDILKEGPGEPLLRWARECGDIVYYKLFFNRPRVMITSPEMLKHIFNHSDIFVKPHYLVQGLIDLVGNGLLSAEHESHKRQRRLIDPSFHPRKVEQLVPVFVNKARKMINTLEEREDQFDDLELHSTFQNVTLDIIGLAGFGYAFNALDDETNELYNAFAFMLPKLDPWMLASRIFPWIRKVPVERNRKRQKALDLINVKAHEIIDRRRKEWNEAIENEEEPPKDLLSTLFGGVAGEKLDDQELMDNVLTFVMAGHETTSSLLTWCSMLLCQNPQWQPLLRDEVVSVIGSADPTEEDLKKMELLERVLKEALRLFPPAAITQRMSLEEQTIKGNTFPKGTLFVISPYVTHRLEEWWGEKPDEFNPDRFLPENSKDRHPLAFMPFIHGRRNCIGKHFAMLEAKTIMCLLLRQYQMSLVEGQDLVPTLQVTLRPRDGIRVTLKEWEE